LYYIYIYILPIYSDSYIRLIADHHTLNIQCVNVTNHISLYHCVLFLTEFLSVLLTARTKTTGSFPSNSRWLGVT